MHIYISTETKSSVEDLKYVGKDPQLKLSLQLFLAERFLDVMEQLINGRGIVPTGETLPQHITRIRYYNSFGLEGIEDTLQRMYMLGCMGVQASILVHSSEETLEQSLAAEKYSGGRPVILAYLFSDASSTQELMVGRPTMEDYLSHLQGGCNATSAVSDIESYVRVGDYLVDPDVFVKCVKEIELKFTHLAEGLIPKDVKASQNYYSTLSVTTECMEAVILEIKASLKLMENTNIPETSTRNPTHKSISVPKRHATLVKNFGDCRFQTARDEDLESISRDVIHSRELLTPLVSSIIYALRAKLGQALTPESDVIDEMLSGVNFEEMTFLQRCVYAAGVVVSGCISGITGVKKEPLAAFMLATDDTDINAGNQVENGVYNTLSTQGIIRVPEVSRTVYLLDFKCSYELLCEALAIISEDFLEYAKKNLQQTGDFADYVDRAICILETLMTNYSDNSSKFLQDGHSAVKQVLLCSYFSRQIKKRLDDALNNKGDRADRDWVSQTRNAKDFMRLPIYRKLETVLSGTIYAKVAAHGDDYQDLEDAYKSGALHTTGLVPVGGTFYQSDAARQQLIILIEGTKLTSEVTGIRLHSEFGVEISEIMLSVSDLNLELSNLVSRVGNYIGCSAEELVETDDDYNTVVEKALNGILYPIQKKLLKELNTHMNRGYLVGESGYVSPKLLSVIKGNLVDAGFTSLVKNL